MPEVITDLPGRRLELLLATESVVVTHTRHASGQEGTPLHRHHRHHDVFLVLEGTLTVRRPAGVEDVLVGAGTLAAVPPLVVHGFVNASDADCAFLNVHAPPGGFVDFLHGLRDGVVASWDSENVGPEVVDDPGAGPIVVRTDGEAALSELFGVRVTHHDGLISAHTS